MRKAGYGRRNTKDKRGKEKGEGRWREEKRETSQKVFTIENGSVLFHLCERYLNIITIAIFFINP